MPFLPHYGTIGRMADHRVRLTERELDLITAALRARRRGLSAKSGAEVLSLAERLEEMSPGNPNWRGQIRYKSPSRFAEKYQGRQD